MPDSNEKADKPLLIPQSVVTPLVDHVAAQDAARGDWVGGRRAELSNPPWPAEDNPVFKYMLHKYRANLAAGADPEEAAIDFAVHSWFESGIENYDRGQRDARAQ